MTPEEHLERAEHLAKIASRMSISDPTQKGYVMSLRMASLHASLAAAGFAKENKEFLEKLQER
jgi:hypothetical protein